MADVPLEVISPGHSAGRDAAHRQQIAADLAGRIDGDVRFGRHDRMLYATDASIYQVEPLGVVIPKTIADVRATVEYCSARGLSILPRGGGTSLAGQTVGHAIVLDLSAHCRRLLSIDAVSKTARVEPGIVLDDLNRSASEHQLMFGPDVATSTHATLGGMIGNNSAGAHSILYGRTVEHVEAVDVLLADTTRLTLGKGAAVRDKRVAELTRRVAAVIDPLAEEIRRRYPRTIRRVNGYNLDLILDQIGRSDPRRFDQVNLAHMVCGAEGTLGVVIGATLRLVDAPLRKGLALIAFASLDEALAAVESILETHPAAVELIDDVIISLARDNVECRRHVELLPASTDKLTRAVLYVEYFANDEAQLNEHLDELATRVVGSAMKRYTDSSAMAGAWAIRKAGEPLLHAMPGPRKPLTFIEDTAVDPTQLTQFVRAFRRIVASHGTTAAYYAHASVGCLHIRPMICLREPEDRRAMEAIAVEVTDLVKDFSGALSGEHGDGRARSHLLRRFYGDAICDGLRSIKAIFDLENRMNPGNIIEPAPMTHATRVQPLQTPVAVPHVKTFFRYDREHGFDEAVHMCNGAGVCRKTKGGTMCPSYRALLDERHATRGRGNALRLAITGQFSSDGQTAAWSDPDTIETLDQCLSCKACKAECPSNVDIAKLKAEYTAQRYAVTGRVPFQTRCFGRVRGINRLGSALHPLANAVTRFGPTAFVVKRLLGIDRRRSLPSFGQSLYRWYNTRASREARTQTPTVALMPDCFTVYSEPHIGRAAVGVLEALGYRVVLPRIGCCGRAAISTGMLAEATRVCRETAEGLMRCVERHDAVAVVGCEPSCISAITDDWLDLELGIDSARLGELAAKTSLIEQFVQEAWDRHPCEPGLDAVPQTETVLLHGHCHQKALWGVESSADLLRRLVGGRLSVIDSGCCGMAGSFGYTPDHYDLSMRIGELALFGAIRAEPEALIVAPGASCRHQILDGTGRMSMHPIELAAAMLESSSQGMRTRD